MLRQYWQAHKISLKFNKAKVKEYLNVIISFLIILIVFQLLRFRLSSLLSPYLGQLMAGFYFLSGFVLFSPLRKFLNKKIVFALVAVTIYFVAGYFFWRSLAYADLHKILAWQSVSMIIFFTVFKYGQKLVMFLYNSAEVKIIPINDLKAGLYINKEYIRQILRTTNDIEEFRPLILEKISDQADQARLWALIKQRAENKTGESALSRAASSLMWFRLDSILYLLKDLYDHKKQLKADEEFLQKVLNNFTEDQKNKLLGILSQTDQTNKFLKSVRGKLTQEQAGELRKMFSAMNERVSALGLKPIDNIILHKTFAFAPFMLLGVVITILTKSSVIHLIYNYFLHR